MPSENWGAGNFLGKIEKNWEKSSDSGAEDFLVSSTWTTTKGKNRKKEKFHILDGQTELHNILVHDKKEKGKEGKIEQREFSKLND